jgi:hypothetical protein
MGRFGHFLLGFVAGSVAFRYFMADTRDGFWIIAIVSICLAAELLYAFRALDKRIAEMVTAMRPQKQE